jgi:hypothetical protein
LFEIKKHRFAIATYNAQRKWGKWEQEEKRLKKVKIIKNRKDASPA